MSVAIPAGTLTEAELVVYRHLCAGLSIREIARRLYVSESGVSMRILRGARRLGARNTAQAVHIATARGLLQEEPQP